MLRSTVHPERSDHAAVSVSGARDTILITAFNGQTGISLFRTLTEAEALAASILAHVAAARAERRAA